MDIKIPKPYHWKTFELLCEALWEKNGNVDFIKQYGRQGQFQSRIDLYGYKVNGDLFAIQCKDVQNLTIPMIEKEINLVLQNNLNIMEKEIVNILENNVLLINKRKDKIGKINLKDKLKNILVRIKV